MATVMLLYPSIYSLGGEWEQGGVEKREREWERRKGGSGRHNLNLL